MVSTSHSEKNTVYSNNFFKKILYSVSLENVAAKLEVIHWVFKVTSMKREGSLGAVRRRGVNFKHSSAGTFGLHVQPVPFSGTFHGPSPK